MLTVSRFVALCFFVNFHGGIPKSLKLLNYSLVAHFLLGSILITMMIGPIEALIQMSAKVFLMLICILMTALFARKFHLFIPALTAILICENMIALIGIPIVIWMNMASHNVLIPFYLSVFLIMWGLAVRGFIFKQLLSLKVETASWLSLVYFIISDVGAYLILL